MSDDTRFRMKLKCKTCGADTEVDGARADLVYDAVDQFLYSDCERGHLPSLLGKERTE